MSTTLQEISALAESTHRMAVEIEAQVEHPDLANRKSKVFTSRLGRVRSLRN